MTTTDISDARAYRVNGRIVENHTVHADLRPSLASLSPGLRSRQSLMTSVGISNVCLSRASMTSVGIRNARALSRACV